MALSLQIYSSVAIRCGIFCLEFKLSLQEGHADIQQCTRKSTPPVDERAGRRSKCVAVAVWWLRVIPLNATEFIVCLETTKIKYKKSSCIGYQ